jgi:hypothetical protein
MKEPRWFLEIKEGLKVSKLLMELENDVANRNAFILIDNSNELLSSRAHSLPLVGVVAPR